MQGRGASRPSGLRVHEQRGHGERHGHGGREYTVNPSGSPRRPPPAAGRRPTRRLRWPASPRSTRRGAERRSCPRRRLEDHKGAPREGGGALVLCGAPPRPASISSAAPGGIATRNAGTGPSVAAAPIRSRRHGRRCHHCRRCRRHHCWLHRPAAAPARRRCPLRATLSADPTKPRDGSHGPDGDAAPGCGPSSPPSLPPPSQSQSLSLLARR